MSNDMARLMNDLTVITSIISLDKELADLQALMGHSEPSTVYRRNARDKRIRSIMFNKGLSSDSLFILHKNEVILWRTA